MPDINTTGEEQTGQQIPQVAFSIGPAVQTLDPLTPRSYAAYRELRRQPTVAVTRFLSAAPIAMSSWSVESLGDDVPDDWVDLVTEVFLPLRDVYVESAIFGEGDYGWRPYEMVFAVDGGRIVIKKLKELLVDLTDIVIDGKTGAFLGFHQEPPSEVNLPVENTLLVNARVEGTNWYGESLMENARRVEQMWKDCNDGARRYDKKIAGATFVVYYPEGTAIVNGVERDTFEVANELLTALESSGSITIPMRLGSVIDDLNQETNALSWRIELLSDEGAGGGSPQSGFIDRLRYLDTQYARGMLMPERAILEGQFGTKAEAGAHADVALTGLEMRHRNITRIMNWHGVNRVLRLNFGPEAENRVFLKAAPLADEAIGFFRETYKKLLDDPTGFVQEYESLDTAALRESVQLPTRDDVEEGILRGPTLPGIGPDEIRRMGAFPAVPVGDNGGGA